jgi:hypothetical protein
MDTVSCLLDDTRPRGGVMDLTFREKSLWLVGISLSLVFGGYFWQVLPASAANVLPDQIGLFPVAVLVLVALQAVGHALLAIGDRRTESDERDHRINLIGERNGWLVLATGVFLSLCLAVFTEGNFLFTHVLLAFWVLASLVSIGTSLWLYRRGA